MNLSHIILILDYVALEINGINVFGSETEVL